MNKDVKIDLTSIKALMDIGIIVSGNSARRSNPERSISVNAKTATKVLERAEAILKKKKAESAEKTASVSCS